MQRRRLLAALRVGFDNLRTSFFGSGSSKREWDGCDRPLGRNAPLAINADVAPKPREIRPERPSYPRPMKGIFVAITVRNCTLASRGRLAM